MRESTPSTPMSSVPQAVPAGTQDLCAADDGVHPIDSHPYRGNANGGASRLAPPPPFPNHHRPCVGATYRAIATGSSADLLRDSAMRVSPSSKRRSSVRVLRSSLAAVG